MQDRRPPSQPEPTELLVCVKCRQGEDAPEGDARPGAQLFDVLSAGPVPEGVTITAVECLQNCDHGCTVALRGGARWTYLFGNIAPAEQAGLILDGAALYHATADGLIPWRSRPDHFKRNCVARVPPPTPTLTPARTLMEDEND